MKFKFKIVYSIIIHQWNLILQINNSSMNVEHLNMETRLLRITDLQQFISINSFILQLIGIDPRNSAFLFMFCVFLIV
jgi:hypothetical protein